MKILVLDDNEPIRDTLAMALETYGHTALLAETPEIAYQLIKSEAPAALILDLTLGDQRGEDVFQEIVRRFGKCPPTLILSAVTNAKERISQLSGARFLSKPYRLEDLETQLIGLLGIPK